MNITKNDAIWAKYAKDRGAQVAYKIGSVAVAAWIDEVAARLGYADMMEHLIDTDCDFELCQRKDQFPQGVLVVALI